jgi:hypothetical protein
MKTFKNHIIQKNYQSFINQTNNLVYYAAGSIPIDHRKRKINEDLRKALGFPEGVDDFYIYQMSTGYGYSRLQYLTIISICSDTESLLRDICENLISPGEKRPKTYFQKVDLVNSDNFIPKGIDLNQFPEFATLKLGFQIRHIAIHNMGFIDAPFLRNTGLDLNIDNPFPITEEIMREHINAFQSFLEKLDNVL